VKDLIDHDDEPTVKFPGIVDNVVLSTGSNYPDALAGVPLAYQKQGPLLLLGSTPESSQEAFDYIKGHLNRNGHIYILGGAEAVPDLFITALENLGFERETIHRIAGYDRYETALAIAQELQHDGSEFYLVQGDNFPDALSASVLAATTGYVSVEKSNYFKAEGQTVPPTLGGIPLILKETIDLLMEYFARNQKGIQRGTTVTALGGSSVIADKTISAVSYILSYGQSIVNKPSVQTLAGSGGLGYLDGQNRMTEFAMPSGIAEGNDGTVYVADTQNHRIRAISGGNVRTVAGSSTGKDAYGMPVGGFLDGPVTEALFNQPKGLAVAEDGTIFVADSGNGAIRVINKSGQVTTLVKGLNAPSDLVLGKEGEIYVTETLNHRILNVDRTGNWSVLAGGGYEMRNNWLFGGYADGQGDKAQFNEPSGLALGPNDFLYVADTGNQRIRLISPQGEVTTLAGSGTTPIADTTYLKGGFQEGPGLDAQFHFPSGVAVASDGTVYVADTYNHRLREISPLGVVKTLAGNGLHGKQNGFPEQVQFDSPVAVKISQEGALLIVDQFNNLIRRLKWQP